VTDQLESRLARLGTRLDRDGEHLERAAARIPDQPEPASGVRGNLTPDARRRTPKVPLLVSALVVLGLVAAAGGWFVWHQSDTSTPKIATPGTAATTLPNHATDASCEQTNGASADPKSGTSRESFAIRNIQVQVNSCATKVFFFAGAGQWHIGYANSKPANAPATLIVRLDGAHASYDGLLPDEWTLTAPSVASRITRVRHRNDANDPGTTWSIRLDRKRPFTASTEDIGGNAGFAINIAAPQPGPLHCRLPDAHLDFTVPDHWYVEMTRDCGLLSPEPIAITPNVGNNGAVQVFPTDEAKLVNGTTTVTSRAIINGRAAVTSYTADDQSPAQQYEIAITWDANTAVSIVGVTQPPGRVAPQRPALTVEQIQTVVDAIAQSATYVPS
jgi:hypothetical protein